MGTAVPIASIITVYGSVKNPERRAVRQPAEWEVRQRMLKADLQVLGVFETMPIWRQWLAGQQFMQNKKVTVGFTSLVVKSPIVELWWLLRQYHRYLNRLRIGGTNGWAVNTPFSSSFPDFELVLFVLKVENARINGPLPFEHFSDGNDILKRSFNWLYRMGSTTNLLSGGPMPSVILVQLRSTYQSSCNVRWFPAIMLPQNSQ